MLISDPALPSKPLDTHRLYRDNPTIDTPSKPEQVTVSPNFLDTEKVKQNEKIEELVSILRTRKYS